MQRKGKVASNQELEQDFSHVPICPPLEHNFQRVSQDGYYKENDQGMKNTKLVFGMIFCTKCGVTKEILIADKRMRKED